MKKYYNTMIKLNPLELKLRIEELRTKYSHNQDLRLEYYDKKLSNSTLENITSTDKPIYRGKVRELYNTIDNNQLLIRTSDRLSGFDRHLCNVPFKGSVLTSISKWWFNELYEYVPNHITAMTGNNLIFTKKCEVIPNDWDNTDIYLAKLSKGSPDVLWK
jgi:phosphoribosylaminoimidazole-succinocarboxamide synthase